MRMKQLKALANIYKHVPPRIYCPNTFKRVFMVEDAIYVTNSVTLVEVYCNEVTGECPAMFNWVAFDLDACELDEKRNRFVTVNDYKNFLNPSEIDYTDNWKRDKFSKLLALEQFKKDDREYYYDAKQVELVMKVFQAFEVTPKFTMLNANVFTLSGANANYSIRAFIMPKMV